MEVKFYLNQTRERSNDMKNCEMLSKLYRHIDVELPTKQFPNGNLCRAVLKTFN